MKKESNHTLGPVNFKTGLFNILDKFLIFVKWQELTITLTNFVKTYCFNFEIFSSGFEIINLTNDKRNT